MAFSNTIDGRTKQGLIWMTWGTWNGTGVVTGNINTGLRLVFDVDAKATANGSVADQTRVDETGMASAPIDGSAVTIDFKQGAIGTWRAYGWE